MTHMEVAGLWLKSGSVDREAGLRALRATDGMSLLRGSSIPHLAGWIWERPDGGDEQERPDVRAGLTDLTEALGELDAGQQAVEFLEAQVDHEQVRTYGEAVELTVRRWVEELGSVIDSADGRHLDTWAAEPSGRCVAVGVSFGAAHETALRLVDWLDFAAAVPLIADVMEVFPLRAVRLGEPVRQ